MFKTEQDREEARTAKVAMAALGWTHRDLAAKTGLKKGTVSIVLSGHYECWPAKAAINAALGREIFSAPQTNRRHKASHNQPIKPQS
jgi:transcriptional regulator with XRE-family HTH domain